MHPSPEDKLSMFAITIDQAACMARDLEDREARVSGLPVIEARGRLASKIKVPAGTLESLRRGRLKEVKAGFVARLVAATRRALEADIAKLEYELACLSALERGAGANVVGAAQAAVAAARAAIEEMKGSK